ncbi:MAG: carboxypeptidase M32 [Planctomycetaceae bacterium]|nr:carboxypeptidase M32 [Planctomycetaceae bacterium]
MSITNDLVRRYEAVCHYARRSAVLSSANEVLGWDERTQLPAGASEHRAEQSTLLAGLLHQRWADPTFAEHLDVLSEALKPNGHDSLTASKPVISEQRLEAAPKSGTTDSLDGAAAIVVRRLKRERDKKAKLPQTLVEELARTAALGEHAWQEAREKDDFPAFRPLLERMIGLKRQQAECLGYAECPYDALLDDFEPGELTRNVAAVLDTLREELVPLVARIRQSGRRADTSLLARPFPIETQDRFVREAAAAIGFDFNRGRLDETVHPFCTTLGPHDCRITTHYNEQHFSAAFFGVLHEAGHGLYEQGLPVRYYGLPLGEAVSLGIHESQSRLWENLVGRSRAFWNHFFPIAQKHFPAALGGVPLDEFYMAVNDVRPSLVRIEADEVTYNLHILIRFELERALLDDQLQVADLPAAWNEKYQRYLGVTPPDNRSGVLQDVHWSAGLIGYFPTYSLGNLYAAQFFAQAESDLGNLALSFGRGDFHPLLDWLRERIYRHGQRFTAAELVQEVTSRKLSARPLVEHLRAKMGSLYDL